MLALELERWVEEFRKKYPGALVTKLEYEKGEDAARAQAFHQAVYGGGLFAERRLVIARGFLKADSKGELAGEVRKFCQAPDAGTVLVLVEQDKLIWSKLFPKAMKELGDAGRLTLREFIPLAVTELERWVATRARQEGGKFGTGVARLLVAHVGGNIQTLAHEVAKLVAYRAGAEITAADIDHLVSPMVRDDVFAFIDAVGRRDLGGASKILTDQFNLGTSPQSLVGLLAWHFRVLASVRDALDRTQGKPTPRELAAELKLHPFVVAKALQHIPYYSATRIAGLYDELATLDLKLKSTRIDPQILFTVFLSKLASLSVAR